ncbi:carbamoyltransferase HypF [bacterium]|nr:carbamoyltransferase HypF [bacterium]RQV95897.1 MAG: carbamoyltransferase HypF [bacterium]
MNPKIRNRILVKGIVQGVGFRPFVYRLAMHEDLKGFVSNSSRGVEIEVEGQPEALDRFLRQLQSNPPVLSKITQVDVSETPASGDVEFVIHSSRAEDERSTLISPDISVCMDCLDELFDIHDRRFRYPFINCTNCGPRYTIIQDIPYDRVKTTMSSFKMCPDCQNEYDDPSNRRFHAQPNACPVCGPRVWLTDNTGKEIQVDDPILETVGYLKKGKIAAIKGLGGFHLACDATNDAAVSRLRNRKRKEEKPLAVMVRDFEQLKTFAEFGLKEWEVLLSPRRPIVLLRKKNPHPLAESLAPRNGYFGVMLPYTPLHYLILNEGFVALVMTSGNVTEEPIAIGNEEALSRLGEIADFFLMHNRGIYLRNDDSVCRIAGGLPRFIRRSRGYVPVPVFLRKKHPSVLAVGGELKNTICLIKGDHAFFSQHVGDLENVETLRFFEESVDHLKRILQIEPEAIAYDLHPDYLSTRWALKQDQIPRIGVQHHHAHIASCLAEYGYDEKVIGLSLDGTGYGTDGQIWGGEILLADLVSFERIGHFAYRPMPGGAKAIQEPWRMAVAYAYEALKHDDGTHQSEDHFIRKLKQLPFMKLIDLNRLRSVLRMIQHNMNLVQTSSLGRLFDGAAALTGLREKVAFEGQAAMEFEMSMEGETWDGDIKKGYDFEIVERNQMSIISPDRVIQQIVKDIISGKSVGEVSYRFHIGLLKLFLNLCQQIRDQTTIRVIALSGGCFQNRFLLENLSSALENRGFEVLTHSHVPTNDGGLALGQAVVASYNLK